MFFRKCFLHQILQFLILLNSLSVEELIFFHLLGRLLHVFDELLRRLLNLFLIFKYLLHQIFVIEGEFLTLPDFIEKCIHQTGGIRLLINEFLKPSLFGFLLGSDRVV